MHTHNWFFEPAKRPLAILRKIHITDICTYAIFIVLVRVHFVNCAKQTLISKILY